MIAPVIGPLAGTRHADSIVRSSMTPAPPPRFLRARWADLVMANYEVDPAVLRDRVPRGTALDLWSGRCFVSVVGFMFLETRVMGVSVPFHRNFAEVNLRFYVQRTVDGVVRRGTVFLKEIVPRRAIAWVANTLYNEKYVAYPMLHDDKTVGAHRTLTYSWRSDKHWSHISATLDGEPYAADDASEEAFITEHYWGYTSQRDGSTLEYNVEHPRWNVTRAVTSELRCDISALYGPEFVPYLSGMPSSCFVADGSAVVVRRGVHI